MSFLDLRDFNVLSTDNHNTTVTESREGRGSGEHHCRPRPPKHHQRHHPHHCHKPKKHHCR